MGRFFCLAVLMCVLFSSAAAGCAEVSGGGGMVSLPVCETTMDASKVHCFYRPGPEGGSLVWGESGASEADADVSVTYGYATFKLWVQDDGSFEIPVFCGITSDAVVTVAVQSEGCEPVATEVVCPTAN